MLTCFYCTRSLPKIKPGYIHVCQSVVQDLRSSGKLTTVPAVLMGVQIRRQTVVRK